MHQQCIKNQHIIYESRQNCMDNADLRLHLVMLKNTNLVKSCVKTIIEYIHFHLDIWSSVIIEGVMRRVNAFVSLGNKTIFVFREFVIWVTIELWNRIKKCRLLIKKIRLMLWTAQSKLANVSYRRILIASTWHRFEHYDSASCLQKSSKKRTIFYK